MASPALVRATYKGLLRAAGKLDGLRASVAVELPRLGLAASADAASFRGVVRSEYRAPGVRVDIALRALVNANQRVAALTAAAAAPPKPADVHFNVGQIIAHSLHGYRGVIIGWDASCKAGADWVAATGAAKLQHGTAQPFYRVLVDVREGGSGPRVSYVAQELAQVAAAAPPGTPLLDTLVVHPLVTRYFDTFDVAAGMYIPTARVAAAYPADLPLRSLRVGAGSDSDSDSETSVKPRSSKRASKAAALM